MNVSMLFKAKLPQLDLWDIRGWLRCICAIENLIKFASATPALRHVRQFLGFSATIGHCNVGQVAMAEGFGGASGANQ